MASSPADEVASLPPEARTESPTKNSADELEKKPALDPKTTEAEETKPTEEHASDSPPSDARSEGEYSDPESDSEPGETHPPLPNEPLPSDSGAPPLPDEPVPEPADDGWDFHWNPNDQSYWFYNRFTGVWQKENPRVAAEPTAPGTTSGASTVPSAPPPAPAPGTAPSTESGGAPPPLPTDAPGALSNPTSIAGGYNPAIHGDYDENAWYAQALRPPPDSTTTLPPGTTTAAPDNEGNEYLTTGYFNRHTGQWQNPDDPNGQSVERHSDESKARRQMRAFFDVDAAANLHHDGRSLKAERAGIKPSRAELKAFKERRKKKKEEKRRAWLRD
ncbi:hypothetical protein B0J18DRAFT_429959 [Chaetomium sp. MPI-SDFR-AT-0129]|nr:hypothetical protein B0J18DRAFT_429959 [Chaetomium sp. MPI-SDFR-AT-0129]